MKSWENYIILLILVSVGVWGCLVYGNPTEPKEIPKALTFMISSNTTTNFTPCGCQSGKYGGLPRRGTIFLDIENSVDWPTLYVDTGDVTQGSSSEVQKKKDEYIFMAYGVIDYDAVNIGYGELGIGHDELVRVGEEHNIPWISANMYGPEIFPDLPAANTTAEVVTETSDVTSVQESPPEPLFAPYVIVEPEGAPGYKVGIIGMMMQDAGRLNPKRANFSFEPYEDAIQRTVIELREVVKVDLVVLLTDNDNFAGFEPTEMFSEVDIVIGGRTPLERSSNSPYNELNKTLYRPNLEPPLPELAEGEVLPEDYVYELPPLSTPVMVPKGQARGKYVRRLDVFFDSNGRIIDYYTEDLKVDESHIDDPRMEEIMLGYDTDILAPDLMNRVVRNFSGSQACDECHPGYLEAWSEHGHFTSYETIASDPEAIEDRECTRCHAIGFTGEGRVLTYDMIDETHRNVGCEGCHTNGQRHISLQTQLANLSDTARAQATTTDNMSNPIVGRPCLECHTTDWSPQFNFDGAIEVARGICLSIHPSYVPPPDDSE